MTDRYTTTAAELRGLADWLEDQRDTPGTDTLTAFCALGLRLRRVQRNVDDFASVFLSARIPTPTVRD